MIQSNLVNALEVLHDELDGELRFDELTRNIYATDASVYQETPIAVAIPKTNADIQRLIRFASEQQIGLIPRTAGTSLAGQVVGAGIVVDVSRHFTEILEINREERWV
ncbi:MAG: FAD-binding protein, partial [bacterium]|nr:FAD-binding protein [bacterium]